MRHPDLHYQAHRERRNEEEQEYQLLNDAYNEFLRVVLEHPDLHLRSNTPAPNLSADQEERMLVIFDMLIALFERAYLVAYAPKMPTDMARRWNSWEDFMREWCRRETSAPAAAMLRGEDPEFSAYIRKLAEQERSHSEVMAE